MTDLSNLRRPDGAHRSGKRLGRGPGSGTGKTSGKGHKGQKARTGGGVHPWFEGGQMPLQRRVPKRGFRNPFRTEYQIVNVASLDGLEETEITVELMDALRLVDLGCGKPIKILGNGEIRRAVTVHANAVSASAKSKIEAAGGTVELIGS
ncbi:MAG TPA: 50S ribosomal protein L15 [Longimicrobiales bacterium]|nr:50S ribosomal protein L15 [Longimicrobiales bacterium]